MRVGVRCVGPMGNSRRADAGCRHRHGDEDENGGGEKNRGQEDYLSEAHVIIILPGWVSITGSARKITYLA